MTANATLAGAVLGRLAGLGVGEFVVCAGARNVPLVVALLARAGDLGLRIYHHFDERTAAFFALGLGKRRGDPVAVLTTSGTAAAELLPAAIEAHYNGIPLVLVTADRPASYRGRGAPQAIEQAGLFGPYAFGIDAADPSDFEALSGWRRDAPLHLNVCFEEPRAADRNETWEPEPRPSPRRVAEVAEGVLRDLETFCEERDGLQVLLGELDDSWRVPVERFLVSLGAPVWAESTSGLRESVPLGGQLVYGEPTLPRRVLRLGGVPSLRLWRDLEEHPAIPVLSVCRRPFSGLARPSRMVVTDRFPVGFPSIQEGRPADMTLLDGTPFAEFPRSEPALVHRLSRAIPPGALVFLGNSLPIREWNSFATVDSPHPRCCASRGANGIDGQVATFLGLSEGEAESWAILGDLTVLYDLNAPALLDSLAPGRRRLVVIHNGGGRIFSRLPSMAALPQEEKQVTENRHAIRFDSWAAMWGMDYRAWRPDEPFPESDSATLLIEARPDEAETEAFWNRGK